jgi:transposase
MAVCCQNLPLGALSSRSALTMPVGALFKKFGLYLNTPCTSARKFADVSRSVNMECAFKENRVAVIALHKCGKSDSQIFRLLKPLKISRNFIYRAIKRYKELWGVEDRARSGRLKSVRAEASIKLVGERIRRSPLWKQKIMSRELNISTQSSRASSGTIYA